MHRSRRRRVSGRSAVGVALALVAAMVAMGAGNAAGAPAAARVIRRSVRTVTRGAARPVLHRPDGLAGPGHPEPEIPPEPEGGR
jgi:hypothetical protein